MNLLHAFLIVAAGMVTGAWFKTPMDDFQPRFAQYIGVIRHD